MSGKRYQLKFVSLELLGKTLEVPKLEVDSLDINFNFWVDLKVSRENKLALVLTDVTLSKISTGEKLAFFKLLCVFEFPDFDDAFTPVSENKVDVPLELEILLKSTGISTIRGVIYSELRGTYLQNAILPFIDIASVIIENRKKNEGKEVVEEEQPN